MFIKNNHLKNKKGGFLVLTLVLLVMATVLIISTGVFLRSIQELNMSADSEKAFKAWSVVNACGEYALDQMSTTTNGRAGWNFASTTGQSLAIGDETCYIYPVTLSGTDKLIMASSTVSGFTRKILIEVATNTPSLVVNSWSVVADFPL
jgi:hypothetical protein